MKGRKRRGRFGTLLFALPIVLIALVVAYQLISETYFNSGTLSVAAQSSGKYYPQVVLKVTATVGTQAGTTPFTLSVTQGTYTVNFSPMPWYSTPLSRTVSVVAGRTSYAVGVYDPIVKGVSVEANQFNVTSISAKHGVTPLVVINKMSVYAVIQGGPTGTIIIQPSQNYTNVFGSAGTYTFSILGADVPNLVVSVA
jgi:hypothetical protein